ncbi:hypothetical protein [Falsarthrobacter nasiphocae]|uniref:Uncharacterized protein n=1 Tax=Falsarthrobacter nasiphocae TaxID=189863 RepID=A0AAE4C8W2_9MICC|nr:hypothetical protein [Falsarthrobacter nasiphocae]MDR6892810.1 hypothetical protein [Falsarthrobacter nasiphocae]
MTHERTAGADALAKTHFRGLFDARVYNYGDYNILVAEGLGARSQETFLLGYRPSPREILVCPLGDSPVVQISEMDVSVAAVDATDRTVGIITTNGLALEFSLEDVASAPVGPALAVLNQSDDVADFLAFMQVLARDAA